MPNFSDCFRFRSNHCLQILRLIPLTCGLNSYLNRKMQLVAQPPLSSCITAQIILSYNIDNHVQPSCCRLDVTWLNLIISATREILLRSNVCLQCPQFASFVCIFSSEKSSVAQTI